MRGRENEQRRRSQAATSQARSRARSKSMQSSLRLSRYRLHALCLDLRLAQGAGARRAEREVAMSLASLILLCAPRSAGRCCSTPQRRGQRLRTAPGPLAASAWDRAAAAELDFALSSRPLTLDSSGYFLISVCHETGLIRAQHYCNTINERGEWSERLHILTSRLSARTRLRPAHGRRHPLLRLLATAAAHVRGAYGEAAGCGSARVGRGALLQAGTRSVPWAGAAEGGGGPDERRGVHAGLMGRSDAPGGGELVLFDSFRRSYVG